MKHLIFYSFFFCFLLPNSKSRIITNFDSPSKYTFTTDYSESEPMQYDTKYDFNIDGGLSAAYEHRIFKGSKFSGFLGAEIMLGKDSNITMAFHSFYFMPTYKINSKFNLLSRLGYTNINTSLKMPNNGYMFMVGTEFNISDNWAIIFSNTWHESTKEKMDYQEACVFFNDSCNDEDPPSAHTRINYNRLSISLVYMLSDKINNKLPRNRRTEGTKK